MQEARTKDSAHEPFQGGHLAVLLSLTLMAVIIAVGGDGMQMPLRYERQAVLNGEWWRLASGHFVHLGWRHLLLNLAGLAVTWAMLGGQLSARSWLLVTGITLAGISGSFVLFEPRLQWYVGLSGLLHGWFAAGALTLLGHRETSEVRLGALLTALIVLKLGYEQWAGPLPLTAESAGGPVVVDAHLYGALAGSVAAAVALAPRWLLVIMPRNR